MTGSHINYKAKITEQEKNTTLWFLAKVHVSKHGNNHVDDGLLLFLTSVWYTLLNNRSGQFMLKEMPPAVLQDCTVHWGNGHLAHTCATLTTGTKS